MHMFGLQWIPFQPSDVSDQEGTKRMQDMQDLVSNNEKTPVAQTDKV